MDVISSTSKFSGKFTFGKIARIEGEIEGEIFSQGILIIDEEAKIKANIRGLEIIINGNVEGNISAEKEVHIGKMAVIKGNIESFSVSIDKGAIIEGNICMSSYHKDKIKELDV